MKSAAFNLAFKVHRNEMKFTEGLIKSVEAGAQEDFIEALNSLAGETRFNVDQLGELIEKARKDLESDQSGPKIDTSALAEELQRMMENRSELRERIKALQNLINTLSPTVIPGVNSFMIFLVGALSFLIIFLIGFVIFGVLVLLTTFGISISTYFKDAAALKQQIDNIKNRKERCQNEIVNIKTTLEELESKIEEKKAELDSLSQGVNLLSPDRLPSVAAASGAPSPPPAASPLPSVPPILPDPNDVPPIL